MNSFRDQLNLLKKFSFRRAMNLIALRWSYRYAQITKRTNGKALPVALSIEPTTACNLACPECPSGLKKFNRPTGNLKVDLNRKIIDELSSSVAYINFYFQGEPFIHPGFLDIVNYANRKNIYTATSTNAHFLNEETARKTVESGLDRLIISIDGTTQEVYEQYRINGKLEKVIAGTKNILQWKRKLKSHTPHVIFQFLVVKPNEHQIEEVKKMARELGVDELRFKTAQVYEFENGNPLIPEQEEFARYVRRKDGTYKLKNKLRNSCWRMWSSSVITWDGKVVPCCFDKDAQHQLGDLQSQSFREIWNSESYISFRKNVLTARDQIDICKNCSEGTKVWS